MIIILRLILYATKIYANKFPGKRQKFTYLLKDKI